MFLRILKVLYIQTSGFWNQNSPCSVLPLSVKVKMPPETSLKNHIQTANSYIIHYIIIIIILPAVAVATFGLGVSYNQMFVNSKN